MSWLLGGVLLWAVLLILNGERELRKPRPWTPQEIADVKAWEAKQLAAGTCPWSGFALAAGEDGRSRCSICDCGGIPAEKLAKGTD